MAKVTVTFDAKGANRKLKELQKRGYNLDPAYKDIGEYLVGETEQRFLKSQAPDGTRWKGNEDSTLANYLGDTTGKKRKKRAGNKRPLIGFGGFTGGLAGSINYQVTYNGVDIGTNKIYGAMMQYGGKKSVYPHLWGDIEARPYLGTNDDDEEEIVNIVLDHLES